jgi:DNA repair exonuclease SbcCD nuclease subunit
MSINWQPGQKTVQLGTVLVEMMGDPHLGRSFIHGVPAHRRGERELSQKRAFVDQLMGTIADVFVIMGDIFDKFVVSPTMVLFAAKAMRLAAETNPGTLYILLRGNHDGSRDVTLKSSFDLLAALLGDVENIMTIVDDVYCLQLDDDNALGFIPWHPFKDASQMADEMLAYVPVAEITAVFGHWDIDDFGGSNSNLIPLAQLMDITGLLITGHVHKPERRKVDGIEIFVTGSMQPYAHGEDLTGTTYRTVGLEEARTLSESGTARDLCLRVVLNEGEELDFEIDCLQLRTVRGSTDATEAPVDFESFNLKNLWDQTFTENLVSSDTTDDLWGRLRANNPDII